MFMLIFLNTFIVEDGERIQLSLRDGETKGGFQRDDHQPCTVSLFVR